MPTTLDALDEPRDARGASSPRGDDATRPVTGLGVGVFRSIPYGVFLILTGIGGLVASMTLSYERLVLAEDPTGALACDISPFVSCSGVMGSQAATIFWDIPNPYVGIAAFTIPILLGVLYASKVELPRWIELGFNVGLLGGIVMITFLQVQSFTVIGAACPWCMLAWVMVIPMFVVTTLRNVLRGHFGAGVRDSAAARIVAGMPWIIVGLWYLVLVGVFVYTFQTYVISILT